MLLVWCGDIAAYYVGRAIGKHKLAPRVSPGKSWEGSIASVIGAVIVGFVLFRSITPIADRIPQYSFPATGPRGMQPFRSGSSLVRCSVRNLRERLGAAGRSGRVGPQAGRGRERLRDALAWTRRRPRSHRCAPVCVAGGINLLLRRNEPILLVATVRVKTSSFQEQTACRPTGLKPAWLYK